MTDETVIQNRPSWVTVTLLVLSFALVVVFILLGNWQVRRLAWKQDLIAAVETRAHGPAASLPQGFDADNHEYLLVKIDGQIDNQRVVLVKAITDLGMGYWVMSPMQTAQGTLWINRGFVPPEQKDPAAWSVPAAPVTGLLRATEKDGTLLETNDPASNRWVARDTSAMSQFAGFGAALPYFLDADHQTDPAAWPRGGLTVIKFTNNHLSYALTWYAMALLFAAALVGLIYLHVRQRNTGSALSQDLA